jgi:hypothetical protein
MMELMYIDVRDGKIGEWNMAIHLLTYLPRINFPS